MQNITLVDYILLPLYLGLFYWRIRKMAGNYDSADLKKFLMVAFGLRMLGSVGYSMLVQYYYGYGDSFTFYTGGKFFTEQISKDFSSIKYLFSSYSEVSDWYNSVEGDIGMSGYINNPSGSMVMKISAILSFLSFGKYLIISIFFGLFSFLGQWKLFMVFDDINKNKNRKLLAYAILYTPSIWFWGSGLLKDSLCLGALGFVIHILYKFFIRRKFSFFDLVLLFFFTFILTTIKSYITAIITVGLMVMIFSIFLRSIKSRMLRMLLLVVAIGMSGLLIYVSDFSAEINDMAEESVAQIQEFQQNYQVLQDSDENSKAGFGLGELDPSLSSLVLKSPAVIFTCLFRPFLWESKKVIILFTSLESTLLLLCTLYIMMKMGILTFFRTVFRNPHLLFCFTISMLFALIIGFTTFNFGTMIRYKIIFLPFYYFLLVNLYSNFLPVKK